jgi:hypothetical protein
MNQKDRTGQEKTGRSYQGEVGLREISGDKDRRKKIQMGQVYCPVV